jgi:hypothetical protein
MGRIAMPWRLLAACALVGVVGGAIFGFVRGLHYVPTLPFAIVEGAILFGVPAAILGLLLAGGWSLGASVRGRVRPPSRR